MAAIRKQYGPLTTVVFQPPEGQAPELCVVLCHGYGATGTDLVPLGFELKAQDEALLDVLQLVFPAAPSELAQSGIPGGRAWWPLNIEALLNAVAEGKFDNLRWQFPPEMPAARQAMLEMLAELQQETQLPLSKFVLGGFSQGAMLAVDVALHLPETPAALCIFSGTLICEPLWRQLVHRRAGMRVLQTHGRFDMILPLEAALWLRDMLKDGDLDVDFIEFSGEHTIPPAGLERFRQLLRELIAR